MSLIIICDSLLSGSFFSNIIGWIIPFLLGLFASFFVDFIRKSLKDKKNRNFIKFYLRNSIYKSLPILKSDYESIKLKIETLSSDGKKTISSYEDFNTFVFDGISSVDYYSAFKEKYILLNEIISIIRFLSENLPYDINNDFYHFINTHLKEKGKIGDEQHILICEACKQQKENTLEILKSRIKEIDILKMKIETLIN